MPFDHHAGLDITRMCLTDGTNPVAYLGAFNIKLFLTSYQNEVEMALNEGTWLCSHLIRSIKDYRS